MNRPSDPFRVGVAADRLLVLAVLLNVVAVLSFPGAAHGNTVRPGCGTTNPFTAALAQQLASTWPNQRFTASVFDERTGCQYDLYPDTRITTASVFKVEIMAGVLLRAQGEGRPLSDNERSLIEPMITQSADGPASQLFSSLGGAAGMRNVGAAFGLTDTVPSEPVWGLTSTSARDQIRLLRQVLLGDYGPVGASYRADAFRYMTSVVPEQRWGITAGVRSNWTVALKNGFAGSQCCGWRLNSTGVVYDPGGGSYVVAILSDSWSNQASGINGVETVSAAIAAQLGRSFITPSYFLRDALTTGVANQSLAYGNPRDAPLVGDWNGDGVTTAGVDRGAAFFLRNAPGAGYADTTFAYGDPGDEVLVGDWNGDGKDSIGIHRGNTFFLRNDNTTGYAQITFNYGDPGDVVVAGDWNGDGKDSIGIVRGAQWFLRDTNSTGVADHTFSYGNPGDQPLAGDWNHDGLDTIAVHRGGRFFLRNQNTSGVADVSFSYGDPGDEGISGDWNGDGVDSIGVVRTRS